jgi:hypothetical protein
MKEIEIYKTVHFKQQGEQMSASLLEIYEKIHPSIQVVKIRYDICRTVLYYDFVFFFLRTQ